MRATSDCGKFAWQIMYITIVLTVFIFIATCNIVFADELAGEIDRTIDSTFIMEKWRNDPSGSYIQPAQPTVYLTFDDGPSHLTPQFLDILKEEGVQATFFVIGKSAEKHADVLQRIVAEGHAIGNHTYDHRYEHLYTSFEQLWIQVQRTNDIIEEAVQIQTRLFRAPGGTHGHFDAFYFYYLNVAGFEIYDWNVDGGDAKRRGVPAREIVNNVKKSSLHHEMHVLLHDSAGHEETLKALPEVIRFYKDQGYQFRPLTANVKPVQQTLTESKWNRTYTLARHQQSMNQMVQFRKIHDESVDDAQVAEEENAEKENDGVQLRTWAEQQDGTVNWNETQRTAYVTFRDVQYRWKIDSQTVERYSLESGRLEAIFSDVRMNIKEGRMYIPHSFVQWIETEENISMKWNPSRYINSRFSWQFGMYVMMDRIRYG